jgi:16S rRNA (cytidine1402-2'-O)-methyltransferase
MSKLYIIPTPIGNLEDITYRAVRILGEATLILAEDTRQTKKLLNHYGIKNKIESHHKFNEHDKTGKLVQDMGIQHQNVALVSDSGTPGISDPGYLLVTTCLKNGIEVETLPGAVAFIPALINSGLPCDKFVFEGFLPRKKGRKKRLEMLKQETRTIILYESPHRLLKSLEQLIDFFGKERRASVSRELTKLHEETLRGSLGDLYEHFQRKDIRGEIVMVIEGTNIK